MTDLLAVDGLDVHFGDHHAVRGVSFSMGREKLAIVGESGSGKSVTARAVLGLLPDGAQVKARRIAFDGEDVTSPAARADGHLLGRRATLVLQDPRHALNPVMTVGAQLAETLRQHKRLRGRALREAVLAALDQVHIRDPLRVSRLYPHEVSGGMGQRAMIAMMLVPEPSLLIADEPTSALDASVELGILETLHEQVTQRGMGLIFISHDLDLVRCFCDRVLVLLRGRIVESCAAGALAEARHPYTRGLLACVPHLGDPPGELATLDREALWQT